ncbi:MAG: GcvT family protein [Hyphomicrobiaceae bacterium]
MPEADDGTAEIVIVGGGVTGLSVAYHLARLGLRDVLLVERNQLTSGTSWHAAGIVGPLRANINLTRLAIYATELFGALEAETGQATGYLRTGGYWLAQSPDRLEELKRIAGLGELTGLDARIIDPPVLGAAVPQLRTDDLAGALFVAEDGQVNPVDLCMAYAKGARAGGVRIREGVAVDRLDIRDGQVAGVVLADGDRVSCKTVVVCAGAWSHELAADAGISIPLQAVEHMYVVSEPLSDAPLPFPVLRDLDSRIYIKGDAGKLVLGGFEPNAKPWDADGSNGAVPFLELPEDWEQFEPLMTAGLHRWPALAETGIQHFMNGPESFTPDTSQVMGRVPGMRNLYVAAGMNSIGIMSSAGVGRVMAEWMADGEAPMDLGDVDIARFDPSARNRRFLEERVREAVGDQFAMHWPYKQKKTGRGIKRTPLHCEIANAGAVFGALAGWERPLWFAATDDEKDLRYSVGDQHWWPAAEREAITTRDGVVLYDLSPFTKIDVLGPDALDFLQYMAAGDVDIPVGRTVYTPILNGRGGVEADVTVIRLDDATFRITSGAATRWRDLDRLRRWVENLGLHVHVLDKTSEEAVLAVMGPVSRDLLASVSDTDFSGQAFPFGTSQIIDIGMAPARATRLSYVGECGWELSTGNEFAGHVYETLVEAGRKHGLGHGGMFALDACRLEKGFCHWGHDIGPEDTPLESRLAFTVAWDKPTAFDDGFLGKAALLQQKSEGVRRCLTMFAVTDGHPLLLHDEPVYRDGTLVGQTTSGARGFRTGQSLCLAWVRLEEGEAAASRFDGMYTVKVAGRLHELTPLRRPAYDPDGRRMRDGDAAA